MPAASNAAVAETIRKRLHALTPEEKAKLGAMVTPEIAAILGKVFGLEAARLMERAQQLRDGKYSPTQATASPAVERFGNVLGKTVR